MRRAIGPILVLVAAALGATAFFARGGHVLPGQKWDLSKHAASVVGQRYFQEVYRAQKRAIRNLKSGYVPDRDDEKTAVAFRGVTEVCAVTSIGRVSEKRVTMEAWRVLLPNGKSDSCLEGRTVKVQGVDNETLYSVEGASVPPLSDDATAFIRGQIAKKAPHVEDDAIQGELEEILPKEPVAEGAEWPIDPEAIDDIVFGGTPLFREQSSGKGRLVRVHVEDGITMGLVDAVVEIRLRLVPNERMYWSQGGFARIHFVSDRPLDPSARNVRVWKTELTLEGIAVARVNDQPVDCRIVMSVTEDRKRGPLDPAPPK